MAIRTSVSRLSLRRALIQIHLDLLKIHHRIWYDDGRDPLTDLESFVLILEDRRFFEHRGIDVKSVIREVVRAVTLRRFGGASTIDMQFVRTATNYRKRTLRRKLYEMLLAWIIQYRYNKYEILRSYVACAFFGSHLFGADAVAQKLFKNWAFELTLDQSAQVAAMLVYPCPLRPTPKWWSKVRRRADYAKRLYPRLKKRFDKLPRSEPL
jgi:membrane peptidoglycan carboxypeptidase